MSFNPNITPGSPPLLWSNIDEAFSKINENFDILVATIGAGSGLIPLDFNTLDTNVSPTVSDTYSLGSNTNRWRSVYTEEWSSIGASVLNGVWIGTAQIKGISGTVDLPANSTVNGNLIIDPDKTFFKSAQVDNGDRIEANEFSDTLNFISGTGIVMTVGSPGESITVTNDGIVTINGIDGITATTVSGTTTISNAGVRSLTNIGALPLGRTVGAGIYIDASIGAGIKITNTGILGFDNSGFGTNVSVDQATGLATVNLSTGVVTTAAFRNIAITGTAGQPTIAADSPADTLTLNAGYGIIINSSDDPEIISFSIDPEIDIKGSVVGNDSSVIVDAEDRKVYADLIGNVIGSVFADDSSQIVDGNSRTVYGNIEATTLRTAEQNIVLGESAGAITQGTQAIAIGRLAGQTNQGLRGIAIGHQAATTNQGTRGIAIGTAAGSSGQGDFAIAIGQDAANINQGTESIAIGTNAGGTGQGANSIAIGRNAGATGTFAGSIILNGTGTSIASSAAGFYVDPIRNQSGASGVIQYDATTKEISYSSIIGSVSGTFTGNIFTNLIDSADSSAITVTPAVIFSSDVTVENELIVSGSRIINLNQLKTIVAASSSFSDFQTRIAALV